MANRYWVGGTAQWTSSNTALWSASSGGSSGASVPTASDSVFFDQAGPYTVTMGNFTLNCLDFTISGASVTIAGVAGPPQLNIYGSFSIVSTTVWSATQITVNFVSTTTGKTINTNGVTVNFNGLNFNGAGGGWTLSGALTTGTSCTTTLTAGSLDIAGFTLSTGLFSSNNSNTRSIAFGVGFIALTTTSAGQTVLQMSTLTNFSSTGTGGFSTATNVTKTFSSGITAGGSATTGPRMFVTAGAGVITLNGSSYWNTLNFVGSTSTVNSNGAQTLVYANNLILGSGTYYINATPTFNMTVTGNTKGLIGTLTVNNAAVTFTWDTSGGLCSASTTNLSAGKIVCTGGGTINSSTSTTMAQSGGELAINGCTWRNLTYTYTGGTITDTGGGTIRVSDNVGNNGTFTLNGPTLSLPITPTTSFIIDRRFVLTSGAITLTANASMTTTGVSCVVEFAAGTITLNNYNLTLGNLTGATILGAYSTAARTIAFGTGYIYCTTVDMAVANNITLTGAGGVGPPGGVASVTTGFTWGTTSGASATMAPNIYFASGATASTLTTGSWFNKLDYGASSFTMAVTSVNLNTLILGSGTYTSLTANMRGTGTINTNSKTIAGLTINCPNGTTTLLSNVTAAAVTSATFTLTAGTLNLNEFAIRCGIFASDNTNTRTIAFGTAGSISVEHSTAATVVISMANISGLTCTGTGGFTLGSSTGRVITIGTSTGNTTNAPNITYTAGTVAQTITTNSKIRILTFTNGATYTLATTAISCTGISLVNNTTMTLTGLTVTMTEAGSVNLNGRPIANFSVNMITVTDVCTLAAAVTTSSAQISVLTAGVLTLNGFTLTVGRFSSSNTNTRSINFGTTNIVMSSTTASVVHLEMSDLTGFTCTKDATTPGGFQSQSSALKTFNIGNTAGGSSINAPNLLFVGSGSAVATITDGSWIDLLNFGTSAFAFANSVNVNSLVLSVGASTYGSSTFTMVGTGSITGNSKTSGPIIINHTGTTTLTMALIIGATTSLTLTAGTLNLNGFGITVGTFISNNTNTRAITFGTANITFTTTTADATNLSMANATGFTCTGTGGFVAAMSVTRTFLVGTTGGSVTGAPNLALTSGAAIPSFGSGSWFNNLNFTGTTSVPVSPILYVDTLTLATGGTYTGIIPIFTRTQTWTPQFSKQLGGIGVNNTEVTLTLEGTQTYVANAPCYVYAGTLNLGGGDRTFGSFVSTETATRNVNFGTNNLILSNSVNGTEVLNVPDGTNFTFTGTGGFTCSVPATTVAIFRYGTSDSYISPPTDVPNLTITNGTAGYVQIPNGSWFKTLTINNISIWGESGNTNPNVYVQDIVVNSAQTNIRPFFTSNKSIAFGSNTLANNLIRGFGISNGATVTITSTGSLGTLATSAIEVQKGTLDLNGYDITIGQVSSATNDEVRAIIFGSNFITLNNNTSGTYAISIPTVTNFTLSGTGGFKSEANFGSGTNYFRYGDVGASGSNTNCPNLTFTSGSGTINFVTGSWFNKVDLGSISGTVAGGSPGINVNSMTLTTAGSFSDINFYYTFTGTGTLITNGFALRRLTINNPSGTTTLGSAVSVTNGTAYTTLTAGTLDLNNFSFSTWLFASNNTNTRAITFGSSNINITNSSSVNTALDIPDATGFTYTGTGGFVANSGYYIFGNIGGGSIANAPNITFITAVNAATVADNSWWKNLNFGTSIAGEDGVQNITGNLTLSPNATYTTMTATMRGTGTITNNNKIIKALILNTSGTVTLGGNLNLSLSNGQYAAYNTLTLTSGNLDLSVYTISAYNFVSGDTPSAQRTIIGNNGTIWVYGTGSPWLVTNAVNLTRSGSYTIKLNSGANTTFSGGSGSYGKLNLVGGGIITGSNSFEDIFSLPAGLYTVKIEAGSTQIVENFNLIGNNETFRATLRSTVDGTQFTLLQTLGTVSVNYLNIRDSNVSAAFFANTNSVNVSNNTGWNFTTPAVVQAGFSIF